MKINSSRNNFFIGYISGMGITSIIYLIMFTIIIPISSLLGPKKMVKKYEDGYERGYKDCLQNKGVFVIFQDTLVFTPDSK